MGAASASGLWDELRNEAQLVAGREAALRAHLRELVLERRDFADCCAVLFTRALASPVLERGTLEGLWRQCLADDGCALHCLEADLRACQAMGDWRTALDALLYCNSLHSLGLHRLCHWLWGRGRRPEASLISSHASKAFAIDIHPAATIGCGIRLGAGGGLVIGETAVVEDGATLMQQVTLGGTGKDCCDRHPKVRRGAFVGAGAKVLGSIEVGAGARVEPASVVLASVPAGARVAGVPAR